MSGITPNKGIIRRVASGVVFITEGNTAPIQKLQNILPPHGKLDGMGKVKVTTLNPNSEDECDALE